MSEREASDTDTGSVLHARWLGSVRYEEALALQRALHERSAVDHLLLLEHPHVYTLGSRATMEHVLVPPESVGAELVHADRGGDVTYHGPGQVVGYPIVTLGEWRAGQRDVLAYVRRLEQVLIDVLVDVGVRAERLDRYTGVWVEGEKIAAIGVRVARGRTRHGFALNVDPDMAMFDHIVPCGIADRGVTSLTRLLGDRAPSTRDVVDRLVAAFADCFGYAHVERQDVAWRPRPADGHEHVAALSGGGGPAAEPGGHERPVRLLRRLEVAGVDAAPDDSFRRPEWMRVKARLGPEYRSLKGLVRGLDLHTVCEEAGCPNIYECWADRTATFMILGERCTRACGFCLVDTRHPQPLDPDEPRRVAEAVRTLGLRHAVVTCVARDDLDDGGAGAFRDTIGEIRRVSPGTDVEVLIADCKGDGGALDVVFAARPDVLNHNLETVARLQRAVRPSAGYARSLSVLARAKDAELVTKSGLILGMGETDDEVRGALVDLRGVGVDIVTIGQYLRPSVRHVPVARWWHPDEFAALAEHGRDLGFAHVEAGPLVRSSYHARDATAAAALA